MVKTFENVELGKVDVIMIKDEPHFIGKQVAAEDKQTLNLNTLDENNNPSKRRGNPNTMLINESGMYSLILSSKLENAKKFKRWVTSEVLPSIRKTDFYGTAPAAPYVLIPKFFRGKQVITIKDAAVILNVSRALIEEVINKPTANLHEGQDYYRLKGDKRAEFKHDNPSIPAAVHHIIAILKSGFEKICDYLKVKEVPEIFAVKNLAVELGLMPKQLQPQQVQAPPQKPPEVKPKSELEQIRDDLVKAHTLVFKLRDVCGMRFGLATKEAMNTAANLLAAFAEEKTLYLKASK